MHWTSLPLTDQIFTHIEPDSGKNTVIAASALRRHCESIGHPILWVALEAQHTKLIMTKRGVERDRLMLAMQTKTFLPLLFCHWPDHTQLLVDGSHSYCAQYYKNFKRAAAFMVDEPIWRNFLVEGLPDTNELALLSSDSGFQKLKELLGQR